ncbi:RICIN domain-containing protein [Kitasatospora sp. NPDC018619]|uniref:RICIN domain-containing protein n=1 Tax=unclassified Kitasatospora TaxID=2633591 RepID=UPI00379CB1BF
MARTKHRSRFARRAGAVLGAVAAFGTVLTVAAPTASAADPMDGYSCEGGGYRIRTPYNMVWDVSKSRDDHGSIVQYEWKSTDNANQQFQVCSQDDPRNPGARFYKFKDHMRWWCVAMDQGHIEDGTWLITEECNWEPREVFWGRSIPGTNLVAFQAQNSQSWLVLQSDQRAGHVVQAKFQADLFALEKVW